MKYYLINEQDIYNLSIEIENLVLSILETKEIEEEYSPEEEELFVSPLENDTIALNLNDIKNNVENKKTGDDLNSFPF